MSTPDRGRLSRLARVNPTGAFLGALVLVLLGFFAPGIIGAAILLLVAGALAYLSRLTWSVQPPAVRLARLVMLTALMGVVLVKLA